MSFLNAWPTARFSVPVLLAALVCVSCVIRLWRPPHKKVPLVRPSDPPVAPALKAFEEWSRLRTNWEFYAPDLSGREQLRHAAETNKALFALAASARPLLPVCARLGIDADVLTMVCDERHRFVLPGGDRGHVEDRRAIGKTLAGVAGQMGR